MARKHPRRYVDGYIFMLHIISLLLLHSSYIADPDISITIEWPAGTYSLPQPDSGCPQGWNKGCWYQDNEDSRNGNSFSPDQIDQYLKGSFTNNVQTCYCTNEDSTRTSLFDWPAGEYCIAKKGNCPTGFEEGSIKWDDEDSRNANTAEGDTLPDGQFDHSTIIEYCCRSDGDHTQQILLPNIEPFILYQKTYEGCQAVYRMTSKHLSIHTDDEDSSPQDNTCTGTYPYLEGGCSNNLNIYYCYYEPTD